MESLENRFKVLLKVSLLKDTYKIYIYIKKRGTAVLHYDYYLNYYNGHKIKSFNFHINYCYFQRPQFQSIKLSFEILNVFIIEIIKLIYCPTYTFRLKSTIKFKVKFEKTEIFAIKI
jgi:hypothetical protein